MPSSFPTSTRSAGFVARGGDAGGGRTSTELTAITGLRDSTGAHGVGTAVGTADGVTGNYNANQRDFEPRIFELRSRRLTSTTGLAGIGS